MIYNAVYQYKFKAFLIENNKKTALHIAVEKENAEIVRLLLSKDKLDINFIYIFNTK